MHREVIIKNFSEMLSVRIDRYTLHAAQLVFCIILLFISNNAMAQGRMTTTIEGVVRDSITGERLPYVAVYLIDSDKGTLTDAEGNFRISTQNDFSGIGFSILGYDTKEITVEYGKTNKLDVRMSPSGVKLNEVTVKPGKEKYSKKNNPAVTFMEELRKRKDDNNPRKLHDYYNYTKYEKISCALNDFSDKEKDKWIFKKFKFIFDYIDTSSVSGKPILNVSIKEKLSDVQYRKTPHSEKEIVKGQQQSGIDEIFNEESIKEFLQDIMREVDIYSNDITIMTNRFVSPYSPIATDFYKFYLSDTIDVDNEKCIELSFVPHNPESFGFLGRLYVPLGDSTMFVKQVKLLIPKSINLNYVQQIYITQNYKRAEDGTRIKMDDDMIVEFQILPSTQGLYARRRTSYRDHNFEPPEDMKYFGYKEKQIILPDATLQPEEFWKENREHPIKESESYTKRLLSRLREEPVFYWSEKVVVALISGYIPTRTYNSKFDFGPMNTTFSGNSLEGFRIRAGGITTANLNPRLFARTYIAYGFGDKKLKYWGELEYSFNKKKYHSREFPIHSIKGSYKYDVDQLGQHYLFTNFDNVFLALKRQKNDKLTYMRRARFEYTYEHACGFSINAGINNERQISTHFLPFIDGNGTIYNHYDETSVDVTLRYAPGEKFYQTKSNRYPINYDAPIFTLKHTYAPKRMFNNLYELNKTELSIQKRFWFSAFGYTDIILKGGKVWSTVSYPNLLLPNANLSYTIQPESFTLMNAMEFANDQYLSWDITYLANGAIFNRIPLLKYLKFREVFSFRGLYGNLSKKNNPEYNSELFVFPAIADCHSMTKTPYMELGVGIDNIFTFLRLDYVWRLTYRNAPGIDKGGLRIQLHFTF